MSHFCVLVITPGKPEEGELERIMQPWHEFKCTGVDDEYVVDVDRTEEARQEYADDTTRVFRDVGGKHHKAYDNQFYREPTAAERKQIGPIAGTGSNGEISWTSHDWEDGQGYRTKVHFLPDGFEDLELPTAEVETFAEWSSGYYGAEITTDPSQPREGARYVHVDAEGNVISVMDRTNPNKKWDWWQVGGRWTGLLSPIYDPNDDPNNTEVCALCQGTGMRRDAVGHKARAENPDFKCNGCEGNKISVKWPTQWKKFSGDQVKRGDLQLEALRTDAERKAAQRYDLIVQTLDGLVIPDFEALLETHSIEIARDLYWNDPAIKALKACKDTASIWDYADYRASREDYLMSARLDAAVPFAVVNQGKWFERGEMGWWGTVSNEKDRDEWREHVHALLDSLEPDMWLTVVDCHI